MSTSRTACLPIARRRALAQAEAELRDRQASLDEARQRLEQAQATLEQAGVRRWERRDKTGLEAAQRDLRGAESDVGRDGQRVAEVQTALDRERTAVEQHRKAQEATAESRQACSQALDKLNHAIAVGRALGATREASADGREHERDVALGDRCQGLESGTPWEVVADLSPDVDRYGHRPGDDRGALGLRPRTETQAEWLLPEIEPPGRDCPA